MTPVSVCLWGRQRDTSSTWRRPPRNSISCQDENIEFESGVEFAGRQAIDEFLQEFCGIDGAGTFGISFYFYFWLRSMMRAGSSHSAAASSIGETLSARGIALCGSNLSVAGAASFGDTASNQNIVRFCGKISRGVSCYWGPKNGEHRLISLFAARPPSLSSRLSLRPLESRLGLRPLTFGLTPRLGLRPLASRLGLRSLASRLRLRPLASRLGLSHRNSVSRLSLRGSVSGSSLVFGGWKLGRFSLPSSRGEGHPPSEIPA